MESSDPSAAQREAPCCSSGGSEWVRGKLLGKGSYGRVTMAVSSASGEVFAVKSVDAVPDSPQAQINLRVLEGEIATLASVDSPYIVRYLGDSWTTEERTNGASVRTRNLHLELAPGGSLAALLKSLGSQGLSLALVKRYTRDILQALAYLHSRDLVHGDVKCLNVLLGSSCAKLADFGTTARVGRFASGEGQVKGPKGSPSWMSPEAVKELPSQGTPVDIWSLGCTVLEMATGRAPWSEVEGGVYGVLYAIGCTGGLPLVPESLSPELREFVLRCLRRDPADRPSAEELLGHPFLREEAAAETPTPAQPQHTRSPGPLCEELPSPIPSLASLRSDATGNDFCALLSPQQQLRSRLKRQFSCLSDACPSSSPSPSSSLLPREGGVSPSAAKKQHVLPCVETSPEATSTFGDSATPSFPLLDVAALKGKLWCDSASPLWRQSPLSNVGSNWIVVHSPKEK